MGPPPTNHEVSAAYWDLSIQIDNGTTTHEVSAVYWDPSIQSDNGTTTHEVKCSLLRPQHPVRQWDHHPRSQCSLLRPQHPVRQWDHHPRSQVQSTETPASSQTMGPPPTKSSAVYWDPSIQSDNGTTTHEVKCSLLRPQHPVRQWDHHPRSQCSLLKPKHPARQWQSSGDVWKSGCVAAYFVAGHNYIVASDNIMSTFTAHIVSSRQSKRIKLRDDYDDDDGNITIASLYL